MTTIQQTSPGNMLIRAKSQAADITEVEKGV